MKLPSPMLASALGAVAILSTFPMLPAMAQQDQPASNASQLGYVANLPQSTTSNTDFRHVVFTGKHIQLVLMTLPPGQEIGQESHENVDQFVRVESGSAVLKLGEEEHRLEPGVAVIIPAGVQHNVVNAGTEPLQLYTIYAPPEHPAGTVQRTKPAQQ